MKGALFFSGEFSAPWGFASPPSRSLAPMLTPGPPHLVIYHFLVEGSGVVRVEDGSKLELESGDIIVLPHGNAHRMSSADGVRANQTPAMIAKLQAHDIGTLQMGGGGRVTRFVCGYMAFDPLLCRPICMISHRRSKSTCARTGRVVGWKTLFFTEEASSGQAGSEAMLAKLSEALFVDTLRRYMAKLPDREVGWLAGARDPIVGKSLTLLHNKAEHSWTIAELAKEVGLSRSALVERFTRYLSEPPMAYLTRWRLQLAARALIATSRGVLEIASDVGYESEAAFNRAFKREFGLPPARYRREHRTAGNHDAESSGSHQPKAFRIRAR